MSLYDATPLPKAIHTSLIAALLKISAMFCKQMRLLWISIMIIGLSIKDKLVWDMKGKCYFLLLCCIHRLTLWNKWLKTYMHVCKQGVKSYLHWEKSPKVHVHAFVQVCMCKIEHWTRNQTSVRLIFYGMKVKISQVFNTIMTSHN